MHLVNEFTLLIKQFYYQDQIQIVENQNIDALRIKNKYILTDMYKYYLYTYL